MIDIDNYIYLEKFLSIEDKKKIERSKQNIKKCILCRKNKNRYNQQKISET